ncbi:MAG: glycosyltransferase family 9 protein [Elusimicrobiota bacterium]
MDIRRILVIKLCCLGDIAQMTPALRALRQRYPQASIDFLCSSWVQELARRINGVRQVLLWDEPYQKISKLKLAFSFLTQVRRLARQHYDLAFIGHRSPAFAALAFGAHIPKRAGFGPGLGLLTHPVAFHSEIPEAQRYLDIAQCLGAQSHDKRLQINLLSEDQTALDELCRKENISLDHAPIAILPGGGDNPGTLMTIKRWDKERFAGLIKKLHANHGAPLILLGGPADIDLAQWITSQSHPIGVKNLAGKTGFSQLLAILKHCRLAIGHDSGPLYLAAALGTPTLMLFGPSDPLLVAPQGPRRRYLVRRVPCHPCYTPQTARNSSRFNGREFICWTGTHECMKELSVAEVEQAVHEMLENAN